MRSVSTWEYGLRDIDLVCVPNKPMEAYDDYTRECEEFVSWFDANLNSFS